MDNKQEYEALRSEIIYHNQISSKCQSLVYSITTAIFTFAFTQPEPLIFLIPVIVILPISLIDMRAVSDMLRIGAYIKVFLENKTPHWETRLYQYDRTYSLIENKKPHIQYYILTLLTCLILFFIRLDYSLSNNCFFWIRIIIALSLVTYSVIKIKIQQKQYVEKKSEFLRKWEFIKSLESQQYDK